MAAKGDRESAELWRASGLGLEFLSAVLAGCALGYGADYLFGTKPWGVAVGAGVGFAAGLTRLVRFGQQSTRTEFKKRNEKE
jgi:ATP synthase protein I